jgi:hypothetical protein
MSARFGSRRKRSRKCSLFVLGPETLGSEGMDRVVADLDELERRLGHALLDHVVERVLHPSFQRHEPFLRGLLAHGLAGRAVDLG